MIKLNDLRKGGLLYKDLRATYENYVLLTRHKITFKNWARASGCPVGSGQKAGCYR